MGPIDQHVEDLRKLVDEVEVRPLPDGSAVVVMRQVKLPPGWNKAASELSFVIPVGYPVAKPDSFWADADLRLANGAQPQNTGNQPMPGADHPLLWFSWHAATWDANHDNLVTYFRVIGDRLRRAA